MKKIILTGEKRFYKANLHCHSVISDGAKTPEELKNMYMRQGYSIIAYTDHDVLLSHNELSDDNFLALNGYEMEIEEEKVAPVYLRACHLCLIALRPDNLKQVCYHRTKYLYVNSPKYRHLIQYDNTKPDFERYYSPECINEVGMQAVIGTEKEDGSFSVDFYHDIIILDDETPDEVMTSDGYGMTNMNFDGTLLTPCCYAVAKKEYKEMIQIGE